LEGLLEYGCIGIGILIQCSLVELVALIKKKAYYGKNTTDHLSFKEILDFSSK
jgi:hypothetical protein